MHWDQHNNRRQSSVHERVKRAQFNCLNNFEYQWLKDLLGKTPAWRIHYNSNVLGQDIGSERPDVEEYLKDQPLESWKQHRADARAKEYSYERVHFSSEHDGMRICWSCMHINLGQRPHD